MMEKEELKRSKLFADCSDEALERLLDSACRRQECPAGRRIFNAGDPCRALMVLVEGEAEAKMTGEEGREVVVEHFKAPALLAPAILFAAANRVPVEVNAVRDCVIWHINRETFFVFLQQEPSVLRAYLEVLSNRGQFLSSKMRNFAVNSLRNRVLEYLDTHGSITSVTKAAQELSATRPSLSRILSNLLDEGLVTKVKKAYRKT